MVRSRTISTRWTLGPPGRGSPAAQPLLPSALLNGGSEQASTVVACRCLAGLVEVAQMSDCQAMIHEDQDRGESEECGC